MTTEIRHAICTTTYWNANQTVMEARYGVLGYFTQLSAWEAATQRDLVAVDETAVAECYSDHDTQAGFDVNVWTTDATRRVVIRAAEGHEHLGTIGQGFKITGRLRIREPNVDVIGITIENLTAAKSSLNSSYYNIENDSNCTLQRCICITNGGYHTIRTNGGVEITDCLIIQRSVVNNYAGAYFNIGGNNIPTTVRRCTFVGGRFAITSQTITGNLHIVDSCVMLNQQVRSVSGGIRFTMNNCASTSGISYPLVGMLPVTITNADFMDVANDNYFPSSTSQLIDQAPDHSGTLDIRRITRI